MNWIHLHLALNHVPVLGSVFLLLLMIAGLIKKSDEILRLSLWCWVALTVIGVPIKFTGDYAFKAATEKAWMEQDFAMSHEQAADRATTGLFLTGIAAAIALARPKKPIRRWTCIVTFLLGLVTFSLMAQTANLGGQIRHTEIRPPHRSSNH